MSDLAPRDGAPLSAAADCYPLKLEPSFRERIWGQEDLSYLYASRSAVPSRVGEVWLTADDNRIANGPWMGKTLGELCRSCGPGFLGHAVPQGTASSNSAAFPLLVKFVFTVDKLSVQVHPSDDYAQRAERSAGKTEMWHVLKAEPGARLAIGFREDLPRPQRAALLKAIQTGAVEEMLNWTEVQAGDTFFIPAGTVHAIGAGLVICEIQQNSDITYRLYDYNRLGTDGRPRELHVNTALDVIQWRTSGGRTEPLSYAAGQAVRHCLAACSYFATDKIVLKNSIHFATEGRFEIWIGIEGAARFEITGQRADCRKGEAVIVPADARSFSVNPVSSCVFLRSYQPELECDVLGPLRVQGYSERQLSRVCFPGRPLPAA